MPSFDNLKKLRAEIFTDGFTLPENAVWHEDHLWVSDSEARTVLRIDQKARTEIVTEVPGRPGGIGFLPSGEPLIVSMNDRQLLRLERSGLVCHANLNFLGHGELSGVAVDRLGQAYVGSFNFHFPRPRCFDEAYLILVKTNGKAQIVARNLGYPQACVLLIKKNQILVAETFRHRLSSFDLLPDCTLGKRRLFKEFGSFSPNGICLDRQGGVWLAISNTPYFVRVTEGGTPTHIIELKGRSALTCQLGGADLRTLFLFSVQEGFECVDESPATARIDIARVKISKSADLHPSKKNTRCCV